MKIATCSRKNIFFWSSSKVPIPIPFKGNEIWVFPFPSQTTELFLVFPIAVTNTGKAFLVFPFPSQNTKKWFPLMPVTKRVMMMMRLRMTSRPPPGSFHHWGRPQGRPSRNLFRSWKNSFEIQLNYCYLVNVFTFLHFFLNFVPLRFHLQVSIRK